MKYLLILIFLLMNLVAMAQSRCFKAYHEGKEVTVFCVGQTIRFKDCSGRVSPEQEYYYHPEEDINNPNKDTVKTITFTRPGPVTITQLANFNNQGTSLFRQDFEVKATPEPTFTITGCDRRTVRVQITDTSYDTYNLDFGNGQSRAVTSGERVTYTYAAEGAYTITLTGSYRGATCSQSATKEFKDFSPLPLPVLSQVTVDRQAQVNGSISISYKVESRYTYLLEHLNPADNSVLAVDTLDGLESGVAVKLKTLENINTTEPRCYRVRVTDACGNSQVSSTVCSIVFNASVASGEAVLTWKTHLFPGQQVEIRNSSNNTTLYTSADPQGSTTISNLTCGRYCYSAMVTGGDGFGIAQDQCVEIAATAAPPAGYLLASYNNQNQVELTLQVPQEQTFRQLEVYREPGGNSQPVGTALTTTYRDEVNTPGTYCYQATYTDDCSATSSLSNTTCPMYLQLREQGVAGIQLFWTAFTGYQGGVLRYEVEQLNAVNTVVASTPATGTTYTDSNPVEEQRLRYRIKAISRTGAEVSYSNILEVVQPIRLFVPSAFSPNNDGLNDIFTVKGNFFENFSIRIYNRSGQVVYEATDATAGWDGTTKGQLQPAGAYVYEIAVTTTDGEKKTRKGTVTLIR
ncbi:T9SS type B sorting domain-containing protein [Pontibacter qinzhouensis]|uniref:T9SS type B sorting domain-containing protein n=1 Tax=Pontibacter qinzhouensis TaxID=2603253 RepID=A0A5C8K4U6_9BACT|nr:gliding motility-associated C-terminal domain-containing protein [Pontibacter qinzhouensis]TXK44891.1 T9SS type B sorting domain-containing protein [Pontibacter qinzhouensis]